MKNLLCLFLFFACVMITGCSKDDTAEAFLNVEFAPESNLDIDLNETFFPGKGAEFDIIVTSNCKWLINQNSKLRFSHTHGDAGSTIVHATLPKSTSSEIKPLTVEFVYGIDGYTQSQEYNGMFQLPAPLIRIEPESWLIFNNYSDSQVITLTTNYPAIPHFDLSNSEDWVTIDYVPGTAKETFDFGMSVQCRVTVQTNNTGKIRETYIKCFNGGENYEEEEEYARSLTITQDK